MARIGKASRTSVEELEKGGEGKAGTEALPSASLFLKAAEARAFPDFLPVSAFLS